VDSIWHAKTSVVLPRKPPTKRLSRPLTRRLMSGVMSKDQLKPAPDGQRSFWGFLAARHGGR
jgi:hypothetical protein